MADITLKDILDLLVDRMNRLDEKTDRIAENQEKLVQSTNHKIDTIRRQGILIVGTIIVVALPVIVDHWQLIYERLQASI